MASIATVRQLIRTNISSGVRGISSSRPSMSKAELGAREKALLEDDPALHQFRSQRGAITTVNFVGNIVVVGVAAAAVLDILYKVGALPKAS